MPDSLTPFEFEGNQLRTIADGNDIWFVASDIAAILGYSQASAMTRTLDPDEKGLRTLQTPGGPQEILTISEAGLYSAILRSRVDGAKRFKRWVTHDVLPAIRRTGSYAAPAMSDDELVARALQITTAKVAALEAKVQEDAPKVLFADAVATSQTDILVGDLAKILRGNGCEDLGANRLFERLREDGFLIRRRGSDWNMPTQRSMELGLFRIKETAITHSDGHVSVSKTPKVTGKGQAYFVNRYAPRLEVERLDASDDLEEVA